MIAAGANVSKLRDYYRRTPLHDAALFGKRAVAEVLIDNGAELVVFEWSETSPIHEAVRRGHAEIAALLLSKGVDPNLRPPGLNIYSLLHVAAEHGRNAIAELLIQHGADVHLKLTITDATALHWALRPAPSVSHKQERQNFLRHQATALTLIEMGADLSAKNAFHETCLTLAASGGYVKVVQRMLEKGVDCSIETNAITKKDIACLQEMMSLLRSKPVEQRNESENKDRSGSRPDNSSSL
ncbi:hypothetical protein N7492_009599 [Penicillium capsulatum]|uniref:Uncharacterized protein n=1 Tax=Penicillium capsulatum TaxID=69766 RepID=A0A9W9HSS4_9EURO|nr:hypothetical protein N7492_009599 [Penicillium capsulatum]